MTTRRSFISAVSVSAVVGLAGCTSTPNSLAENGYEINFLDSIDNATYIDSIELGDVVRKESILGDSINVVLLLRFKTERGATPDPDTVTWRQEEVSSGAYVDSYSWEYDTESAELKGDINRGPVGRFSLEITKATSGISEQTLEEVDFEIVESEA